MFTSIISAPFNVVKSFVVGVTDSVVTTAKNAFGIIQGLFSSDEAVREEAVTKLTEVFKAIGLFCLRRAFPVLGLVFAIAAISNSDYMAAETEAALAEAGVDVETPATETEVVDTEVIVASTSEAVEVTEETEAPTA